jgi:predicted DNA-binding transcriptional regulator AlpA
VKEPEPVVTPNSSKPRPQGGTRHYAIDGGYYDVNQAAEALGMSRSAFRVRWKAGQLPHGTINSSGMRQWLKPEIDALKGVIGVRAYKPRKPKS